MAIEIIRQPEGIYPAYNDSFLEFKSDLLKQVRAEITLYPVETFPRVFTIYKNEEGNYLFNLKEAVKVVFNVNGFEDSNYFTDIYYKTISGLYLEQEVKIEVFTVIDSEDITEEYQFFKAVKQIGEPIHDNLQQLLTYSPDGVNHSLTYFEGFPFHFDILRTNLGSTITVKNLNTGSVSEGMASKSEETFRINIDKGGGHNWTSDNFLPLTVGLNRLEIWQSGTFNTNLLLTKKKKCSGIYLKWFNRNGGFSHYLFDEYFISRVKSSVIGRVFNDEFLNITEATGNFKITGKGAEASINIKTKYESRDYELLKDIFTSPLVQMFTSKTAYVEGYFIDIVVDGSISFSNKRGKNEIALTVDLPEVITAKL